MATSADSAPLVYRGAEVSDSPDVTVCLPVMTAIGRCLDCLDSLAPVMDQGLVEVVVMANGLPTADRRVLEERNDLVVVRSETNLGFAGGNNLAADYARGRYLLLLNDDSTVEAGCVERLLATAEADPTIGAVGGRILSADGSLQEAGSVLWRDGWATHVGAGLPGDTLRFAYVRDVDYASANGLLVRKSAWDAVGGLDPQYYPAYFEDADLCLTLRRHHFRVVYEPRARLRHLEGQSTSWRYRNFLLRRNRELFIAKWADELTTRACRPAVGDDPAIERAIHRARGDPPRVLLVGEASGGAGRAVVAEVAEVAEELARRGWAVVLAPGGSRWTADGDDPGRSDRMVDLGVDRRDSVTETLTTLGTDFAVVVTTGSPSSALPQSMRPAAPTVLLPPTGSAASIESIVDEIEQSARRTPIRRGGR